MRLHNQLVLQDASGQTRIIAVGAPEEWASRAPLPGDAVITDLVEAAISDPSSAGIMWTRFLGFLLHAGRDPSPGHRLLDLLLPSWVKVPVSVVISDAATRSAIIVCVEEAGRSLPLRLERLGARRR